MIVKKNEETKRESKAYKHYQFFLTLKNGGEH